MDETNSSSSDKISTTVSHKRASRNCGKTQESSINNIIINNNKVTSEEDMEQINKKFDRMEDQYSNLREEINKVKSSINQNSMRAGKNEQNTDNDTTKIDVIDDAFTFIMVNPLSLPAATAYFIYFIQMASYLLVISHHYTNRFDESDFLTVPALMVPKGVDEEVHFGQGIGILLIALINESLWEPIVELSSVDRAHLQTQGIATAWWVVANFLRLTGGLLLTLVMFFLVIESDDVVELFKDFTAMIFVSSFDNMLYSLAKLNLLGARMKKTVDDCQNKVLLKKNRFNSSLAPPPPEAQIRLLLRKCLSFLFKPSSIMCLLLITMYVVWGIFIVQPQRNGKYLCQNFYVQLDDTVDSKLPFFSGSYVLQKGDQKRDFYQTYRENKDCIDLDEEKHAMIIRYCKERGFWALSLEDNENRTKECNPDTIFVKSVPVSHQAKFNIFEVSFEDWLVKNPEDKRWMPLNELHLSCQDKGEKYTTELVEKVCPKLVVDERNDEFKGTRSWSTNFTQMVLPNRQKKSQPVQVYSRPVYFNPGSNNEYDLLFFVGKRWIITSSSALLEMRGLIQNETNDRIQMQELATYLNNEFHGNWSKYRVAFFSEPVLIDTPQDRMSPVGLTWFSAIDDSEGLIKEVDDNMQQSSVLICSLCNADTNPCFYEGICHSNNTCECTSGSSGTLCQVLPTQNGLCDETFNNREFDFDGGDCCINTCVSKNDHICGSDKTGRFYVGYDRCEVETCNDCWRTSTNIRSSSFTGMIVTYVSLSPSGRVLALIESISSTVRIYDIDGSKWIMRGSAVTTSLQPTLDKVDVSEIDYYLNRRGSSSPLTVAVRIQSTVHVFDWRDGIWEETKDNLLNNASLNVEDVQLRNNGKSLGILYKDYSFSLFERFSDLQPWGETKQIVKNKYESFSFSDDGKILIMANKTCIDMYTRDKDEPRNSECFTNDIKKVQISKEGQSFAVLTKDRGINGDIFTFTISGHNLTSLHRVLRGVSFEDASIGITDKGENIAVHSSSDNLLQFFIWEESKWKREKQVIKCKSMYASRDNSVIAVLPTRQDISSGVQSDSVKVYHKNMFCDNGMSKLRLTFVPDSKPSELSWEISEIDPQGDLKLLASGGPYNISKSTIIHELCIDDSLKEESKISKQCIVFTLLDEGLDGLHEDGVIGISLDGFVNFTIDKSYGYNNTYPVLGNMDCLSSYNKDDQASHTSWRYSEWEHIHCVTVDCEWTEYEGLPSKYSPTTKINLMTMSSDGSVIAIGIIDDESHKHQIQILQRDRNDDWTQLGSNITVPLDSFSVRFYSLSADGSVIAIFLYTGQFQPGKIQVYKYNEKMGDWSKKGNDILLKMGFMFYEYMQINSAGNQIVISGLNGDVDVQSHFCVVQSFLYVSKRNVWVEHGNCIFSTNATSAYHNIAISSNGLVVAISHFTFTDPSFVKVFILDAQSGEWMQKGKDIKEVGPGQHLGIGISLSADGSILALGGRDEYPIRVYKLNESDEWSQFGYDISIPSPNIYILPVLSASGLTLGLSSLSDDDQIMSYIFLYDWVSQLWVQSPSRLPLVKGSSHSTAALYVPYLVASADLRTVGLQSDRSLKLYHLTVQSSDSTGLCNNNQITFNFTIKPDQFPEDIEWLLQTKDEIITAGRLASTVDSKEVNYKRCIPTTSKEYFLFYVLDMYGDGICCEWGEGHFVLEWNNTKVMDSVEFEQHKIICLSNDDSKVSLLTIFFDIYPKHIVWSLLNSNFEKELYGSGSDVSEEQAFTQCIPKNECFYVVVKDYTGNGVPYSVTYDGEELYEKKNAPFYLDRVKVGNCQTKMCSQEQTLMEFYFLTTDRHNTFTWDLVNGNNSVIDSSNGLYEDDSFIIYERCILASVDECVFLRLIDMDDEQGFTVSRTVYSIELNGNETYNNMTSGGFQKMDILGSCNDYFCKDNAFFQLFLMFDFGGKGNSSHENSWELIHNNTIIEQSTGGSPSTWEGYFIPSLPGYYVYKCLSVDAHTCLTLQLKDSGGDGGIVYHVNYHGKLIDIKIQYNDLVQIKMGNCSD